MCFWLIKKKQTCLFCSGVCSLVAISSHFQPVSEAPLDEGLRDNNLDARTNYVDAPWFAEPAVAPVRAELACSTGSEGHCGALGYDATVDPNHGPVVGYGDVHTSVITPSHGAQGASGLQQKRG